MKLDIKILDASMRDYLPAYATPGSAGLDLRACAWTKPLRLNSARRRWCPRAWRFISKSGLCGGDSSALRLGP
ncbi:MAG: Deoxyuridine 5'-triphosphate nucleotidohydrolase (EC [uncultured Caballeronia sp.]|nr:MAG: Deoxyuridine 5'-triphosphate nucleotidohydrolase (EC [uncultured Caballeronia sp.]